MKKLISLFWGLALLAAALLANLWWAQPAYNWDLVPYVAAVVAVDTADAENIHTETWRRIEQRVPADKLRQLRAEGFEHPYRSAVARDPESLSQQLPLARVKPLYIFLLASLGSLGIDTVAASTLISATAYCLLALLIFHWLCEAYRPVPAALIAALLVSLPFVQDLAMYSSPDALSVLLLLSGLFLAQEPRRVPLALAVFLVAILARPDNLLLLLSITAVGILRWREYRPLCLLAAALGLALFAAQMHYSGMYGWSTTFYHAFIQQQPYPASAGISLELGEYLRVLLSRSHPLHIRDTSYNLLLMVFLLLLLLRLQWARLQTPSRSSELLIAVTAYAALHWLILPNQKDRLLADLYLLVLVLLALEVQRYASQRLVTAATNGE